MLEEHRERVRAHMADLKACLRVLDGKIAFYTEAEERTEDDGQQKGNAKATAGARA
jgi:hypothetical protein